MGTKKFDPEDWARATRRADHHRSELDRNPELKPAIENILTLMANGESEVTVVQIHQMLKENYGITLKSTEGVRRWMYRHFPDLTKKALHGK